MSQADVVVLQAIATFIFLIATLNALSFYFPRKPFVSIINSYEPLSLNYVPHWYLKDPLPRNVRKLEGSYNKELVAKVDNACVCYLDRQCIFHAQQLYNTAFKLSDTQIEMYKKYPAYSLKYNWSQFPESVSLGTTGPR